MKKVVNAQLIEQLFIIMKCFVSNKLNNTIKFLATSKTQHDDYMLYR